MFATVHGASIDGAVALGALVFLGQSFFPLKILGAKIHENWPYLKQERLVSQSHQFSEVPSFFLFFQGGIQESIFDGFLSKGRGKTTVHPLSIRSLSIKNRDEISSPTQLIAWKSEVLSPDGCQKWYLFLVPPIAAKDVGITGLLLWSSFLCTSR